MVQGIKYKKRRRTLVTMRDFAPRVNHTPSSVRHLSQAYRGAGHTSMLQSWPFRLTLIGLFALVVVIVYSPILQIRNIIVTGVKTPTTRTEIAELVRGYTRNFWALVIPQNNLLFFNEARAKENLTQNFAANSAEFQKQWPNVLRVSLTQDVVVAKWQNDKEIFLLDRNGKLMKYNAGDTTPYILINDVSDKELNLGDSILDDKSAEFLGELSATWTPRLPNIKISKINYNPKDLPTWRVITENGFYILVTTSRPLDAQLLTLVKFIAEKGEDFLSKAEYIDVRFGSRVNSKSR